MPCIESSPILSRQRMVVCVPNSSMMIPVNIEGSNEALHTALDYFYRPFSINDIQDMILHQQSDQSLAQRIFDLIHVPYSLELTILEQQRIQIVQWRHHRFMDE